MTTALALTFPKCAGSARAKLLAATSSAKVPEAHPLPGYSVREAPYDHHGVHFTTLLRDLPHDANLDEAVAMIEPAPRRRKYHFGGGDGRNRRAVKSLAHTPDLVVCKDTDPAAEVAPNVSPNAVDNAHRQECACRRPCARLRTRDDLDFPTKSAGATPTTPRQAPSRSPPTRRRHRQPHQELGQPAPPTHPATSHISFSRNRHANGHHLQLSRNRHANGHHLQLSRNPHGELPAPAAFAKPPRRTASTYSFRETPTANCQHLQLSRNPHGELPAPTAFAKPPRRTASTCSFRETAAAPPGVFTKAFSDWARD